LNTTKTHSANPLNRAGSRRRLIKFVLLSMLLGVALLMGRDLVHHLRALENWMASLGWAGPVVFIVAMVVLASLLLPDTVFGVLAGALFGPGIGTLLMIAGSFCTAAADFVIARLFLKDRVGRVLSRRPRLASLHEAVHREGLRFQFLVRLTPLNPVIVNYVFATSRTRFPTYLMACAGMIPTLVVEVYFGARGRHWGTLHGANGPDPGGACCLCGGVALYHARRTEGVGGLHFEGSRSDHRFVNVPGGLTDNCLFWGDTFRKRLFGPWLPQSHISFSSSKRLDRGRLGTGSWVGNTSKE